MRCVRRRPADDYFTYQYRQALRPPVHRRFNRFKGRSTRAGDAITGIKRADTASVYSVRLLQKTYRKTMEYYVVMRLNL